MIENFIAVKNIYFERLGKENRKNFLTLRCAVVELVKKVLIIPPAESGKI